MENIKIIALVLFLPFWAIASEVVESPFFTSEKMVKHQAALEARFIQYPGERGIGFDLLSLALANEDFATAQETLQKLRSDENRQEKPRLDLLEVQLLRYRHRPKEAYEKARQFILENSTTPEAGQLVKRLPVIKKSRGLKLYQGQRFRRVKLPPGLKRARQVYAQPAGPLVFLQGKKNSLYDTVEGVQKKAAEFGINDFHHIDDLQLLHNLPAHEAPPYFYRKAEEFYLAANSKSREIKVLEEKKCQQAAISPWMNYIIASCPTEKNQLDLFLFMLLDKKWQKGVRLGAVNSRFNEISPAISTDGRFLTFSSNGHFSYGAYDIFVSEIQYAGDSGQQSIPVLQSPQNVFSTINSFRSERMPFQFQPGVYIYGRSYGGQVRIDDYLKTDQLKPVETISFQAEITGPAGKPVSFEAALFSPGQDGRPPLEMLSDHKTNWIHLHKGQTYQLRISSPGFFYHFEKITADRQVMKKKIPLRPIKKGASIIAGGILYGRQSAELDKEALREVDAICQLLQKNPGIKVLIEGHTDSVGPESKNQALSERRATSVLNALVKKGIDKARMQAKGFGESRPIATNQTLEGRSKNRRTEVKITAIN